MFYNKLPRWFRLLIRMCGHRDCGEIFVPFRDYRFIGGDYLCSRHAHHKWEFFSPCTKDC